METVRIELEGDYAIVLKEMRHSTAKILQALVRRSLGDSGVLDLQERLRKAPDDAARRQIITENSVDGEDEIILLNQVIEWSFGAVSQEILDNIPQSKYQKLASEVDRLYTPVPFPVNK